ncbi:MAG: hypothetical protein CVU85_03535 [Firmicutes bacterium HGW-Firmicutes-10]|jgi:hypothetical protein|nr:MAG: hypothetical protein CVU85_03535 [Firmicutes bacterium HGW-Firmicutes-10]
MVFNDIIKIIDVIGKVKDLLLNEQEKQIVKDLVLKLDEGNLFNPKNKTKYALIGNTGNFTYLYHYQKYLDKHARAVSKALGATKNAQLIDKLSGFRTVIKEFIQLDEEFEISDDELVIYRGKELPRLREDIDRYRWIMSQCIMSLINTVNMEISTVKKENFIKIGEIYE